MACGVVGFFSSTIGGLGRRRSAGCCSGSGGMSGGACKILIAVRGMNAFAASYSDHLYRVSRSLHTIPDTGADRRRNMVRGCFSRTRRCRRDMGANL